MGVPVPSAMVEPLPPVNHACRAGGLPIRLLAAQSADPVTPPPADDTAALARTLRGLTLLDLYVEAGEHARACAACAADLEGLAAGRTYGDRTLQAGFVTPAGYRAAALAARRRADIAGATADLLRGLLGGEAALAAILTEGVS